MKSTWILSVVIIIMSSGLIYESQRSERLQKQLEKSLNQFDTVAALCKDATNVAKAWEAKYDSCIRVLNFRTRYGVWDSYGKGKVYLTNEGDTMVFSSDDVMWRNNNTQIQQNGNGNSAVIKH